MALERMMAERPLMPQEVAKTPANCHQLYIQIHEKLKELRALRPPVPDGAASPEARLGAEIGSG